MQPLLAVLLAALPVATPDVPAPSVERTLSPHAQALREHPYDPRTMEVPLRAAVGDARFTAGRTIFGYLPYWVDEAVPLHYEWMTHLAYFSAEITAQATLSPVSLTRLGGPRYESVRAGAKAKGVKFVLTFTNFDKAAIPTLVGARRADTVKLVVDTVKAYGAEGANIDFEGTPSTSRADYTQFVRDLSAALHEQVPGSHLSLALPMIDWSNVYDVAQLAPAADALVIMGYDCHWRTVDKAGPVAPLDKSTLWGRCSSTDGIDTYVGKAGAELRGRVILGVPFYGFTWPTESDAVNAKTTGAGTSSFWAACRERFATDRRWDADSDTPWTTWVDGTQRKQMWCDDAESLDLKLELLVRKDVGGLAIWALGYDGTGDDAWSKIRARLGTEKPPNTPPVADAGSRQYVVAGKVATLDGSRSSDADGDSLTFHWTQKTGAPVEFAADQAKPTFVPPQAGIYTFRLVVNDGTDDSAPAETEVLVDPAPVQRPDAGTIDDPGSGGDGPKGCGCGGDAASSLAAGALALFLRRRR